jgi:hypothetical protein
MRVLLSLLVALSCLAGMATAGRLACGVCEALVDEVNLSILTSEKTHTVQTRFRVDEKKRVPYSRTEHHLLEIMEADDFPKRFEKYGVVKPWTKTAKHMKRAYSLAAEGKEIEAIVPQPKKKRAPPAPAAEAATDPAASASAEGDAAAAAPADSTPSDPAKAAETEEVLPVYVPFKPSGALPLSLRNNHFHLVEHTVTTTTGLNVERSATLTREIKDDLDAFLEEYLDEAMLMFHRDVPDLKEKLCVEITEACVPKKKKSKKAPATEVPAAEAAASIKDEL